MVVTLSNNFTKLKRVTALWPLHIDNVNFAFMNIKMQEAMRLLHSAREEIARLQQLKIDAESAVQEALLDMQNTER